MKKQVFALSLLLSAVAAQAQIYASIAAGSSHISTDCTGTSSCDTSDTGVKLTGGYELGNGFSLELGYLSFGKFRAADGGVALQAKPTAFTFGGAYSLPINSDWGMNFRLGAARVKAKLSASAGSVSGSDSESSTKPYAGLGVSYAVSSTTKLELGYDSTRLEYAGETGTIRLITVGARFAF